jgi:hypothetical protein
MNVCGIINDELNDIVLSGLRYRDETLTGLTDKIELI